jgi:hypothetical protein
LILHLSSASFNYPLYIVSPNEAVGIALPTSENFLTPTLIGFRHQ